MFVSVDPTRISLELDPRKRRMSGIAVHGNTPFDVPYISQITETLWMGGCADGLVLPDEIVHVVSLYPWEAYELHDGVSSVTQVTVYDSAELLPRARLEALARWAWECADEPTLVHCQAGLNRSGLLTALALMLGGGWEAEDAIAELRKRRSPAVLCNQHFVEFLLSYA